jgi:hypothetical protein
MPQLATITSFYTFSGNTKARATNVNTNFSNFRGHLLPIDPNTISCIGDTYDVGSVEYRFNKAWVNYVEFDRPTTTCSVTQFSNTAVTAGSLITQINSISVSELSSYYNKKNIPLTSGVSEIKIGGATISTLEFSRQVTNLQTTTANYDYLIKGVTACSILNGYGVKRPNNDATTSSSNYGTIVYVTIAGDVISNSGNSTLTSLGGTITISTLGRPIIVDIHFRGEMYMDRKTITSSFLFLDAILQLEVSAGYSRIIGTYWNDGLSLDTSGSIGIARGRTGVSGSKQYIVLAPAGTYNMYIKTSVSNPITATADASYYFRIYSGNLSAREVM